jgi:hypothetical protein
VETTPFYAAPDAQRVLVRFHVYEIAALAGRLRVFDSSRNLLGTAGVLPVADGRLYGELWVPLIPDRRIVSELSVPGARARWDFHFIRPGPRWVVRVFAVVDPASLVEQLESLPPWQRAAETALLSRRPIYGNPLGSDAPALLDHVPLLQIGRQARVLEQQMGIRMSPIAIGEPARFNGATVPLALVGSGTRHAVILGAGSETPGALISADGSVVHVAPPGRVGDMTRLEMAAGGDRMARALERWLTGLSPAAASRERPPTTEQSVYVIGTDARAIGELAVRTAGEWNSRYSYPRVVVDGSPPPLERFEPTGTVSGAPIASLGHGAIAPDRTEHAVAARLAERSRRARAMVACLADAMVIASRDLAGVAQRLATGMPGTLVFNPSPYTRTDLARFPDGIERLVTDVPANGYAFLPGAPDSGLEWRNDGPGLRAEGPDARVELQGSSGAIRSLVSRADGYEWARPGSAGLNAFREARLDRVDRLVVPGVATRLRTERSGADGLRIRSSVTVYDGLPWIDIVNEAVDDGALPETAFTLASPQPLVAWEIPAGWREARSPVEAAWLRWMRVSGETGALLIGGFEAPLAAFGADGTLTMRGAARAARFRLAVQPSGQARYLEEPWRLGWSMEPLLTAPVPGTGGMALPSFGSLVQTSDLGAPIIALEHDESEHSILVYVQDVLGVTRRVAIRGGVLSFGEARLSDLVGRDKAPLDTRDGTVVVEVRARGVVAVKLLRLDVRAG